MPPEFNSTASVWRRAAMIGTIDRGADILEPVFDGATIGLAAEMVGISAEVFDRTIAYLKTREQFGSVIGTFQGLKHRAAHMFCEVELSQAIVLDALRAIDEERADVPRLASAAKARLSDTASLVTCEGVQMHGGIGMTDEEEIGLFMKRAKAAELDAWRFRVPPRSFREADRLLIPEAPGRANAILSINRGPALRPSRSNPLSFLARSHCHSIY